MSNGLERTWRQITSKRSISGADFPRGVVDFDFSVGGKTVFIPSKSYFRIGVKLTNADGVTAPTLADDVAFANFCPGNLFDNVAFYAGGQNVSSIVNYAAQAHTVAYRLKKSGAWLSTIGKDAYGYEPTFDIRQHNVITDAAFPIHKEREDESIVYFMYQPPIGIMEHSKPLGSGDYRFQFNPNSNYQTACVESVNAARTSPTDFQFSVESMELYTCTEKMDVSPTGTDLLHLMEHQVQSKPIGFAGDLNYDFTIPPSTKAISIFIQSANAGSDTRVTPSFLGTRVGDQMTLKSVQLTYANITKPPTRWTSQVAGSTMKLQQRYLDTQIESTQAFSSGGCETFNNWLEGGTLLHYNWARDASDRSTQLQLQADFNTMSANTNMFIVAHYSRTIEMSVTNGFISEVRSLSI